MRGFAIEEDETGPRVTDDRGTTWAGFAPDNPAGAFLAGFVLDLVREAYAFGHAAAPAATGALLGLYRGRGEGLRTWDVRLDGPAGPRLASDGRHPLHPLPPRRARLMLAIARCAFEVAVADRVGADGSEVSAAPA